MGAVPSREDNIPSLPQVKCKLKGCSHPFQKPLEDLWNAEWCKKLHEARHRVVHRGFWPEVTHDQQFQFAQNLQHFSFGARNDAPPKKTKPLDLVTIMRGLVSELQAWDLALAPLLEQHAPYKPYSKEEVIVSQIGGQPSADWALEFEVMHHAPTPEFQRLWAQQPDRS